MLKRFRTILLAVALLGVTVAVDAAQPTPSPTFAQSGDATACDDLVRQAIREIGSTCRELGRNEACYGNTRIDAELSDDSLQFAENGDIVGVESLLRLTTQPADPDTGEWGIAVVDILADLPESADGNVRLLMFGGVDVQPALPEGIDPDQPTCEISNTGTRGTNFRVGPSTDHEPVDSLRPNQTAVAYGISADGDWYRTARGWIAADFVANECADTELLVIDDLSDAYFAPMQSFTMALGEAGTCSDAPRGLLIQTPTDQTANIMINNVELRIGSTAFVSMTDDGDLEIGNLEGNVIVTAAGETEALQLGNATTIADVEDAVPTEQMPWGEPVENLPDEVFSALPREIAPPSMTMPNMPNTDNPDGTMSGDSRLTDGTLTDANTNPDGTPNRVTILPIGGDDAGGTNPPGTWLPCGSCNTCGYPANECVTSPDGVCLWDPATCRTDLGGGGGQMLDNPGPQICTGTFGTVTLSYSDVVDGDTPVAVTTVYLIASNAVVVGGAVLVDFACPPAGETKTLTVTVTEDTSGPVNVSVTFNIVNP